MSLQSQIHPELRRKLAELEVIAASFDPHFARDFGTWLREYQCTKFNLQSSGSQLGPQGSHCSVPSKARKKTAGISLEDKKATLATIRVLDVATGEFQGLTETELMTVLDVTQGWELCQKNFIQKTEDLEAWAKRPTSFWNVPSTASYSDLVERCSQIFFQKADSTLKRVRNRMAKSLLSQEILRTVFNRSSEENCGFNDLAMRMWSHYHPKEASLGKDYKTFYKQFMTYVNHGKKLTLLGPIILILQQTQAYERKKLTKTELHAVREYAELLLSTDVVMKARLIDIFWTVIDCNEVQRTAFQQVAPDDLIASIAAHKSKHGLPQTRSEQEEHERRCAVPLQPAASEELNNLHDSVDHIGFADRFFEEEMSNLHNWTDHTGFDEEMGNLHNWTDHIGFSDTGMNFSFGDGC